VDRVQPQLDIVELLAGLLGLLDERDVHGGDAGPRVRFDPFDLEVLRHLLFDPAGHELLDLVRAGARPGTKHERLPDADVRVLALRHPQVAVDAGQDGADQQHPRDVARFGEEPGGVVGVLDNLAV
jgi:hypothetical protein